MCVVVCVHVKKAEVKLRDLHDSSAVLYVGFSWYTYTVCLMYVSCVKTFVDVLDIYTLFISFTEHLLNTL